MTQGPESAALDAIAEATEQTPFEGCLWVVGGAVRDHLLGRPDSNDFDLVIGPREGPNLLSSVALIEILERQGLLDTPPTLYAQFGTAMVHLRGAKVEIVAARKESYRGESRKPIVEPATLEEDAARRDFTINALLFGLHGQGVVDPLGRGVADLRAKVLRTPLEPKATFSEDPLRMLRAVRFRHLLGFEYAEGVAEAIHTEAARLEIVSAERIRDELEKMLLLPEADRSLADLMDLGLIEVFAPELTPMKGCEQGGYHHLDVWKHTLLVVHQASKGDLVLVLAALLHDIGKPATRSIDEKGQTRFFGHETLGAEMAAELLRRLRFPQEVVHRVSRLVKAHMRLGSAPVFTPAAARRLIRDLDDDLERLLELVEADASGLRPGVRMLDLAPIRAVVEAVQRATPRASLESPLSGREIMDKLGLQEGPEVGRVKAWLLEQVLEGKLDPQDRKAALTMLENVRLRDQ